MNLPETVESERMGYHIEEVIDDFHSILGRRAGTWIAEESVMHLDCKSSITWSWTSVGFSEEQLTFFS